MEATGRSRVRPSEAGGPRRKRLGMTLAEVMVAVMVVTISVYLLSSAITATAAHTAVKRERGIAVDAAWSALETMRGEPFEHVFYRYNRAAVDDPDGPGTAPGAHFDVPGLMPRLDDPDGHVGEIVFSEAGPRLREDLADEDLGLPRDLNGDMRIDALDHAIDYIVLPLKVRVQWTGRAGARDFEMYTMLGRTRGS